MIETGEIKKVTKSGWCTVRFPRKTACENCNMCLKSRDEMFVELKLKNTLGASEGDTVSVEVGDRAVVSASFIVYLIPLALLGIALGVTSIWKDLAVSLGAAGGALIIGFGIVSLIDKKVKEKKGFAPKMVAVINGKTTIATQVNKSEKKQESDSKKTETTKKEVKKVKNIEQ